MKNKNKKSFITNKNTYKDNILDERVLLFFSLVIILFLVLFLKLISVFTIDSKTHKENLKRLDHNIIEGESTPRGRILDRNYKVIVDNKAVKTIYYKKSKDVTTSDEINSSYEVSKILNLNYDRVTESMLRNFYYITNKDKLKKRITSIEWAKLEQGKLKTEDIIEKEKERIKTSEINKMSNNDRKAAYLYHLMNNGYKYSYKTIKKGEDLTEEEYAYIAEHSQTLKGFGTSLDWERTYPYGNTLRSILGTVSTSTQGIPSNLKDYYLSKGYSLNDRVGLSYLEKEYENYLKGTKAKYELLNSYELKEIKAGKRGNDIVLSIDIELQKALEEILEDEIRKTKTEPNTDYYDHSSVVIEDPKTGEILAMSSKRIVGDKIIDNTPTILTSPITPGSVVKGASMLVGYNEGALKIGDKIVDECIKIAGTKEKCSSHTLGLIDDITALAKSSNVYQFKTAIKVNDQEYYPNMKLNFNEKAFEKYRNMYHEFGLGVKTGIDIGNESTGYHAKDSKAGNLLDFVMGQYETYTPIQLSQYITTIANDGERLEPHLLKEVRKSNTTSDLGEVIYSKDKKVLNKIDTKKEYLDRVKEGFYAVCHAQGAYGVGYIDEKYDAAGKTGTSQSFIDTNNDGKIDTETITSSFIGYAPRNNPKMSIIVTSPDSSRPDTATNYASLVTMHITKRVTNKYFEMYGIN